MRGNNNTKKRKFSVTIIREMIIVDEDKGKAIQRVCKLLNINPEYFNIEAGEIDLSYERLCGRGLYKNDEYVNNSKLFGVLKI